MLKKNFRESQKVRDSAKGQPCAVRILNVCNYNPETTVYAHLAGIRFGHGMGHKTCLGAYCCSDCHDAVDGRAYSKYGDEPLPSEIRVAFYAGVLETTIKLIEQGLLEFK